MAKELVMSLTRDDFDFTYFRAGGPGGQKQNKTSSACRVVHRPSGAVAESRVHREQHQNKRAAWKKCVDSDKFRVWLKQEIARANLTKQQQRQREEELQKALEPANIQVEIYRDGKWVKE